MLKKAFAKYHIVIPEVFGIEFLENIGFLNAGHRDIVSLQSGAWVQLILMRFDGFFSPQPSPKSKALPLSSPSISTENLLCGRRQADN